MPPTEGGFRQIGERTRLEGHFFTYVTGTFVDPDGFTFEREIIRHPGAVCVVAMEDPTHLIMVRQYRAALDRFVLELPAGKLDVPGEETSACAQRELIEEVGREAGRLSDLGKFHNSPGFTDETTTCFLAEDLRKVERSSQGIEEHYMTIETVALADVPRLFSSGELSDAKSLIAIALAQATMAERLS